MQTFSIPAIRKAMAMQNISTQKALKKATGLSTSTVSRIFGGTAKPEASTVDALVKVLKISRAELFGEETPSQPTMDLTKEVYIEIIGKVRATPFRFSVSHGLGKFVRGKPGQQDCKGLEVEGESMMPVYVPGDIVVCRPHRAILHPYAENDEDATFVPYEHMTRYQNRDVIVTYNGETNLKRIQLERKHGPHYDIFMVSMNKDFPRVKVKFGDEWEVQALVVDVVKPELAEP